MVALVGLVVLAGLLVFLGVPLWRRRAVPGPRAGAASGADNAVRNRVLRQLSELEYDYRMGKMSRTDYEEQRRLLLGELAPRA